MVPAERVALIILLAAFLAPGFGLVGGLIGMALAVVAALALYVGSRLDPG